MLRLRVDGRGEIEKGFAGVTSRSLGESLVRLVVARLAERVAQPLKTLVKTVTGSSAGGLDVLCVRSVIACSGRMLFVCGGAYPGALPQAVEAELVGDLSGVHGVLDRCQRCSVNAIGGSTYGQILLVGEDEEKSVPQLVLVEHALQLLAGLDHTVTIVAVDDEDDALGVLEVMPPQRTDLVLSTDIPHGELDVLVLDSLNVEA